MGQCWEEVVGGSMAPSKSHIQRTWVASMEERRCPSYRETSGDCVLFKDSRIPLKPQSV